MSKGDNRKPCNKSCDIRATRIEKDNLWKHIVPTALAICGVNLNTWHYNLIQTHEESVTSYRSFLRVGNIIDDKGDPDGGNVQTGLADPIG
jgi:hypothetical protein